MNGFKTIMCKELIRVFKDKKMVFSMFILPLFMVVGIYTLIFTLVANMKEDVENNIGTAYVLNAPEDFVALMDNVQDLDIAYLKDSSETGEIRQRIVSGDAELLVEFPDDFTSQVTDTAGKGIPQIKTYYNPSEDYSVEARSKMVDTYFEIYKEKLLADKFGDVSEVIIFTVDNDNPDMEQYDSDKATGKMLGAFIPYIITMLIFAGAMGLGVDSIAGEKERGTLASLLLAPVKRVEIVMGKIAALGILSIMSAMVYVIGMLVAFPMGMKSLMSGDMVETMSISFSPVQIIQFIILIIGIVLMYVSIIAIVAVLAKNIKEAQSYISPVYFIVLVAGMINMYTNSEPSMTSYLIPVFNMSAAMKGIFVGDITTVQFMASALVTYGFAGILIGLTAKAFNSEKIMFNA